MNNLTIKPNIPTAYKYYGEPQSVNIRYAIATIDSNNIVENAHEFVSCREYLTSFLYTIYHKKVTKYEYYDCITDTLENIPKNYLYLIVRVRAYKTFQRNFKNYMHYYDGLLNVKSPTELIIPEKSANKYFIIKCDLLWTKNLVLFSILSWILRMFCHLFHNLGIEPFEHIVTDLKWENDTDQSTLNDLGYRNILQFLYVFQQLFSKHPHPCYNTYYKDSSGYSFCCNGIYYFLRSFTAYNCSGYAANPDYKSILQTYKQLCDANPVIPYFQMKNDKPVGLQNQ